MTRTTTIGLMIVGFIAAVHCASPYPSASFADSTVPGNIEPSADSQIKGWITELDNDNFAVRQQAAHNLAAAGSAAVVPLAAAIDNGSPETVMRATEILQSMNQSGDEPLAMAVLEVTEQIEHAQIREIFHQEQQRRFEQAVKDILRLQVLQQQSTQVLQLPAEQINVAVSQALEPAAQQAFIANVMPIPPNGRPAERLWQPIGNPFTDEFRTLALQSVGNGLDKDLWQHMAVMTQLEKLTLRGPDFDDDALMHLLHLERLGSLTLSRTSVSDEGIGRLAEASNLWHLHLGGLEFTNDALDKVASLRGLESLTIGYYTNVNDDGLQHLLGLRHLDTLRLEGTNFTDDAVKYLVGMRSLKKLILSSTSITADGIDRLRQDLPEVEIEVTEGVAEDILPGRQRIFRGC